MRQSLMAHLDRTSAARPVIWVQSQLAQLEVIAEITAAIESCKPNLWRYFATHGWHLDSEDHEPTPPASAFSNYRFIAIVLFSSLLVLPIVFGLANFELPKGTKPTKRLSISETQSQLSPSTNEQPFRRTNSTKTSALGSSSETPTANCFKNADERLRNAIEMVNFQKSKLDPPHAIHGYFAKCYPKINVKVDALGGVMRVEIDSQDGKYSAWYFKKSGLWLKDK